MGEIAEHRARCEFNSDDSILACHLTFNRGIQPSKAQLYLLPETKFDRKVGNLDIFYRGSITVQLTNAAVISNTLRANFRNRDPWRWSIQVVDRRWKWRYCVINGTYNEVGLAPRRDSIKNIKELIELCLDALGETGYDTSAVPTGVNPPVVWNAARADLELQWLCDLIGFVPVLKLSSDTVTIEKLNDTSGTEMPTDSTMTPLPTAFTWKEAVIPQNLRVQGDPTIYQSELTLSPYGLETDGTIEPIGDLSYKPTNWTNQWPFYFSDVAQADRDVALQTVYRWFVPTAGWNTSDITVSSFEQLELIGTTIERVADGDGVDRPAPMRVRGTYWPYSDLSASTPADTVYNGAFHVDSERGLVIFEQPVFQISGGQIADPVLKITCAYRLREASGDGYAVYTRDLAVTKGNSTTNHRILHRPDITKEVIDDSVLGAGSSNNESTIQAAADVYLSNVEATYDYEEAQDAIYHGIIAQDLDGSISQVEYSVGDGVPATTRMGRFTEVDIYSMHRNQRRAQERLAQMAQRMNV